MNVYKGASKYKGIYEDTPKFGDVITIYIYIYKYVSKFEGYMKVNQMMGGGEYPQPLLVSSLLLDFV